jgi:hypothetical protein
MTVMGLSLGLEEGLKYRAMFSAVGCKSAGIATVTYLTAPCLVIMGEWNICGESRS